LSVFEGAYKEVLVLHPQQMICWPEVAVACQDDLEASSSLLDGQAQGWGSEMVVHARSHQHPMTKVSEMENVILMTSLTKPRRSSSSSSNPKGNFLCFPFFLLKSPRRVVRPPSD
jgi:hypothetical protein